VIDTLLGTVLTAPVILFLCEITPKAVGAKANQVITSLTIEPLSLTYDVLKPVRKVLTRFVALFARWSDPGGPPHEGHGSKDVLKESDFLLMLEEGHREGAIHDSELGLIRRVFQGSVQGPQVPPQQRGDQKPEHGA
jgi:CBS domain containing-hemolysin-like protein